MAWLSGYSKRKELPLTGGASGAQTNFQLQIDVSYEAAMQGDFDDIRFTQADGTTLVDAWAEVIVADTSATVWVEFPSTPANTVEQTYYMYYGNGSAASEWDIDATFLFGDDFADTNAGSDVKFGLVGGVNNHNGSSTTRLQSFVTAMNNTFQPSMCFESDDFVNGGANKTEDFADLVEIEAVYDNLNMDRYYVIGNHELEHMSKTEFADRTGMTDRYHSFDVGDYHFIVLDVAYDSDETEWDGNTNPPPGTGVGYIVGTQKTWLTNDLAATSKKTIVISQSSIGTYYCGHSGPSLGNSAEIRTIFENSGKVILSLGYHFGCTYKQVINGINYVLCDDMTDHANGIWMEITLNPTTQQISITGHNTTSYEIGYGEVDWTNKWQSTNHALYSQANGNLVITNTGTSTQLINSKNAYNNFVVEARMKKSDGQLYELLEESVATYTNKERAGIIDLNLYATVNGSTNSASASNDTWYRTKMVIPSSGDAGVYIYDDAGSLEVSKTGTPAYRTDYISFLQYSASTGYVDWILVRKYASGPPTYAFGSEESVPVDGAWYYEMLRRRNR